MEDVGPFFWTISSEPIGANLIEILGYLSLHSSKVQHFNLLRVKGVADESNSQVSIVFLQKKFIYETTVMYCGKCIPA